MSMSRRSFIGAALAAPVAAKAEVIDVLLTPAYSRSCTPGIVRRNILPIVEFEHYCIQDVSDTLIKWPGVVKFPGYFKPTHHL